MIEKALKHWKHRTVRRKFEMQCRTVSKITLSQNIIIQKYMQFLHGITQDFIKSKFLDIRINSTGTLDILERALK